MHSISAPAGLAIIRYPLFSVVMVDIYDGGRGSTTQGIPDLRGSAHLHLDKKKKGSITVNGSRHCDDSTVQITTCFLKALPSARIPSHLSLEGRAFVLLTSGGIPGTRLPPWAGFVHEFAERVGSPLATRIDPPEAVLSPSPPPPPPSMPPLPSALRLAGSLPSLRPPPRGVKSHSAGAVSLRWRRFVPILLPCCLCGGKGFEIETRRGTFGS